MSATDSILDRLHRLKRVLLPNVYPARWPIVGGFLTRGRQRLLARPIKIGGFEFFTDPEDSLGLLANRNYSPDEQILYRASVKPGFTCVELGANIGFFSTLFGSLVGDAGRVYAFEPSPINAALLRKNLALNGLKNVEVIEKAVADKPGTVKLFLSDTNYGDNRIYASDDLKGRSVEVETTSLDLFFSSRPQQIDFIKMDIQGAEFKALGGMANLLRNKRISRIVMEFWPFGLTRFGDSPQAVLDLLQQNGFKLHELTKTGSVQDVSAADLIRRFPPESEHFANLLAVLQP